MKLELDADEARELLSLLVDRIADEAGLPDEDRARLKRWRSESMKTTSEGMKELTARVNTDLERALRSKEKSAIRKPDWV